jgi:hypothetical protein
MNQNLSVGATFTLTNYTFSTLYSFCSQLGLQRWRYPGGKAAWLDVHGLRPEWISSFHPPVSGVNRFFWSH